MATITVHSGESIQAAINAANNGDIIQVEAGTYNEQLTVDVEVTIQGGPGVILEGPLLSDLGVPDGTALNDFMEANHSAYTGTTAFNITASNVSISGFTVTSYALGVLLNSSDNVSVTGNTFVDNIRAVLNDTANDGVADDITNFTFSGNSVSQGVHGVVISTDAGGLGSFDGITMDNNTFSHLSEKGVYFEMISNASATGNSFDDVGNYGRISPPFGGTDGAFGSAVEMNLKFQEFTNVVFNDTEIDNSGHSNKDGAAASAASGNAVSVKLRDDSAGPAVSFVGAVVFNGLDIDGTSTGVRVGEPGKSNSGPDVVINDLKIDNATVGDVANVTHATNGGEVTVELADGQTDFNGSNSTAPLHVTGNDLGNTIDGGSAGDSLNGAGGDDTLDGNGGNDTIDGGAGTNDVAVYSGLSTDYTVTVTTNAGGMATAFTEVKDNPGFDGIDTLSNVESVQFTNATLDLADPVQLFDDEGHLIGTYDSIQSAIDAAADGQTVRVAAGEYTENVTITGKDITLQGMGNDQTVLHGQITVDGTLDGDFAIKGIDVDATGHQYAVFVSANSTAFEGTITLDGVTLENAQQNGFAYIRAGNGSTPTLTDTVGSIAILNSVLTHNATQTGGGGGAGDIIIFGYNQDLTISDVTISDAGASAQKAIQLRGLQDGGDTTNAGPYDHAGDVSLTNVNISGTYLQDLLAFYRIADFDSFTTSGVVINAAAPWGLFNFDEVGGTIDLSSGITATNLAGSGLIANPQGLSSADTFVGTSGFDVMAGRAGDDDLTGGGGNDVIDGGADEDSLTGDAGDDQLLGQSGDDSLTGGAGDDTIDGGAGKDTASYTGTITTADLTANGSNWSVDGGAGEGTDTITNVEVVHSTGGNILLVGSGGFATIQEAIDAASDGDTILVAAGTYNEQLTVDVEVTIQGGPGVILEGPLLSDLGVPDGTALNDFMEANHSAYTGTTAFNITASNVSISGFTVTSYALGVLLNSSDNVSVTGNTFVDNIRAVLNDTANDGVADDITNFTFSGNSVSQGVHGVVISTDAGGLGSFDGITMDNNTFSHLSEKGVYFEMISNASATGNSFDDVGNYGRISPPFGGTDGAFGSAVEMNLKFQEFTNVVFNDTEIDNSGHSNKDGAAASAASGNAVSVKLRDDSAGPAVSFDGAVVFNGLDIDGTSTGVRVGEPGKNNSGPDVVINDLKIDNATVGDVANVTHATNGGEVTVELADSQTDFNGSNSTAPLHVTGNDLANEISGGSAADTLEGGVGSDTLNGNQGNDTLNGGAGADTIDGGAGTDTASYTGTITTADLTANGTTWSVDGGAAEGTDTLSGVEVVHSAGGDILLVGSGGYATIQEAIDNAGEGDTILIAEGTYTENLSITHGVTLQGLGDGVIINPASGNVITISGDLGGDNVSISNVEIAGNASAPNQGIGVHVQQGANVGTLTLDGVDVHGNGAYGVFVDGEDTLDAAAEVNITNSTFENNGFNGTNGSAHIKLYGFDGDANLSGLTLTGGSGGVGSGNVANLPDYGIEFHGIPNANLGTDPSPDLGAVTISDVTATGDYHKNVVALNNYADIDGVSIDGVDLSGTQTNWGPVFNIDANTGDVDASGFDITYPAAASNGGVLAELQGDSSPQAASDQSITGGSASENLRGGAGADVLTGNGGNDQLNGQAGEDTAHFNGTLTESEITYDAATGTWVVDNSNDGDGTDRLAGIETITDNNGNTFVLVGGDSEYGTDEEALDDHAGATVLHTTPSEATDTDGAANVVAEGATAGTSVHIDVNAADTTGGVTYELIGANKDAFAIDANGVVTVADGSLIDYENSGSEHQLQITVRATNSVGGFSDTTFDIDVTDVAPVPAPTVGPVMEGATTVGSVKGTGGDTSSVSYSIIPNADGSLFSIDADGNLSFNSAPDFENPLDEDGDNVYRVNVLVFDDGNFIPKSYDVAVTDEGLGPLTQVDGNAGNDHVFENSAAGTTVGITVTATDGSGTPTYSIIADSSNGGFTVDANGVVRVADGTKLDFETASSHTVTVQAESGADTTTEVFTIAIDDQTGANINSGNGSDTIDGTPHGNGPQALNVATSEDDEIHGNGGNDTIDGLAGNDEITGDAGNDTLDGSAGNDEMTGGAGKDIVRGGDDDDTFHISGTGDQTDVIDGGTGTNTVVVDGEKNVTLAAFNDTAADPIDIGVHNIQVWTGNDAGLLGTSAANVFDFSGVAVTDLAFVDGGNGNDTIIAGDGADYDLRGGSGNDTLTGGDGDDTLTGGKNADTLDGGAGSNTVSYAGSSAAVNVDLSTQSATGGDANGDTLANFQNAIGSSRNDTLAGDLNANELTGGAGTDTVSGGAGDDIIHLSGTGDSKDIIDGGADDDTLMMDGSGSLTLEGFDGGDWSIESFVGNGAALLGTSKANTFDFTGVAVSGLLEVNGGSGNDTIIAGDDDLRMIGGAGTDTLTGGAGDDTIVISGTGDSKDTLDGGLGTDTIEVGGSGNVTLTDFDAGAQGIEEWDGNGKALLGTSAENVLDLSALTSVNGLSYVDGGSNDDMITGSDSVSLELRGGSGDDTLQGGSQGDTLIGGAGADELIGGIGDDVFVISGSGDAHDSFEGGGGMDTIRATGNVTLNGFDSGAADISAWVGTSANGHITGTSAGEVFDFSNLTSVTNLTYVDGGSGADTIIGSDAWAGDLRGGSGSDQLTGGSMDDLLKGGSGADTFVFEIGGGHDTIMDFTVKSKTVQNTALDDHIDLVSFGFDDYMTDVHTLMTEVGKDVEIDFGNGDVLTIRNTTIDILDAHQLDFILQV